MPIRLKRIYEPQARSDGVRILVERLWPRGVSKAKAAVDLWMKDIAPSADLRKWFAHDPEKWAEFKRRYRAELEANKDAIDELRRVVAKRTVTFVFAAKDEEKNSAALLKAFVENDR